jgi:hypothetical protein
MLSLGALLGLSARKPWGRPVYDSPGNWRLLRGGRVMGRTIGGRTLVFFDEHD